jgi:hypothetical protein
MEKLPFHWGTCPRPQSPVSRFGALLQRLGEALLGPSDDGDRYLMELERFTPPPETPAARNAGVATRALDWLDVIDRRFAFDHYQGQRRELVKALRSGLEGIACGKRDGAVWWRELARMHPQWFAPPDVVHRYSKVPAPGGDCTMAHMGSFANEGRQRTERPLYQVLLAYPFKCDESEALHAFLGAVHQFAPPIAPAIVD